MKILFFAPNYLPSFGGVEKHIYYLTNELISDGHEVEIIVNSNTNENDNELEVGNIKITRIPKIRNRFINRLAVSTYLYFNVRNILKKDIIHVHDFQTFEIFIYPIYPILSLFKRKVFITFHGWEGVFPPKKSVIWRRKLVEKLSFKNIAIGHYISKWYKSTSNIISYGGVIPVSNIDNFTEDHFLFIGRLESDTGIFNYLKAWKIISKSIPDFKLLICGEGSLEIPIKLFVKKNRINNILFLGHVSDITSYISSSKIIFTSGYLGILESLSCRKKVIATYDNPLKEDYLKLIPNYNNMFWVAGSVNQIAEASVLALSDTNKAELGYKFSIQNNWEKVRSEYYRLWQM